MTAPLVSVILPTYRRAHLIGRALGSVLAQSHRDLEVLVMDDASDDATEAVVRAPGDPRVHYHRSSSQRGAAAMRNQGIALARGSYVAFQDSDDEWLLDKLELQLQRLQSLPADFALTQGAVLRHEGWRVQRLLSDLPAGGGGAAILRCNMTTFLQGWLARKTAILEAGGFDERLPLWEDWELLIRIAQKFRVDIDQRAMAVIYETAGGLTQQDRRRPQAFRLIMAKHGALMQRHRATLAFNLYTLARLELMFGTSVSDGRALLRRSLRLDPWQAKTWAMLILSLFGTAPVRLAASLRLWLRKRRGG